MQLREDVGERLSATELGVIRGAVLTIIGVNLLTLLGWGLSSRFLIEPFRVFPPARPAVALAFLLIALAFWRGLMQHGIPAMVLALTATLIALGGLVRRDGIFAVFPKGLNVDIPGLDWGGATPLQLPLMPGLLLLLSAAGAMLLLVNATRYPAISIFNGFIGTALLALAATTVLARVTGFFRPVEYGLLVGVSLQSIVSSICCGGLLLWLALHRDHLGSRIPNWLPYAAGVASAITFLFLWKALVNRERLHMREQVGIALAASQFRLNEEFTMVARTLQRVLIFTGRYPGKAAWHESIGALVRDTPWLDRVLWVDAGGRPVGAVPVADSAIFVALRQAADPAEPAVGDFHITALPDSPSLLASAALCDERGCRGTIGAQITVPGLVEEALGDTAMGFHFAVWLRDRPLMSTAPRSAAATDYLAIAPVGAWNLGMMIHVWPTDATLARARSELPSAVLILGLLASVLLLATLSLSQRARRAAEREERARVNRALGRATDGIWEWDIPSGIANRSPELWRHLGYLPTEMAPRASAWSALIHPEDRSRVQQSLASHVAGHRETYEAEYRIQARDGQWHEMIDRGRIVERDERGAPLRALGISADITERKRTERAMREMESLSTMGRLAARVAHEINNPLGGIQNGFMLLKDSIPTSHPHYKYVGAIEREIQRIAGITRQLYETYRPEKDGAPTSAVQMVITDAVSFLLQVNRTRGVRIAVAMDQAPQVLPVPDAILRQCVFNLIQNAVEASPDGALIQVTASREAHAFVLRVRDHGPGVPGELRERIFDPFFSTKDTSVRTGGMGLGLSLVRRSLQSVGGHIDIVSPPDGGAEFVVRFPLTTNNGVTEP